MNDEQTVTCQYSGCNDEADVVVDTDAGRRIALCDEHHEHAKGAYSAERIEGPPKDGDAT